MASKEEKKQYLATVNPVVEKMLVQLLIAKPSKPLDFMIKWLEEKGIPMWDSSQESNLSPMKKPAPKPSKKADPEASDEDDEEEGEVHELPSKEALAAKKANKGVRQSVSAEVYGEYNKKGSFQVKVIPKSEDQKARILQRLNQAFMFSALDDKEKEMVLLAMDERKFAKGDTIIKQGDDGDNLYVVDSGELKCYRKFKPDAEDTYLKTYQPGDSFGELALLYNAPRAATIIADGDSVLFALDRDTFNHIVKDAAARKREQYESFLSKIELLESMDPYERSKVADAFKPMKMKAGQYVMKEGEKGDMFYFLEEGEAKALKKNANGEDETVFEYKAGDYFGELALLRDTPRAASIIAQTDLKLVTMDRYSFKRLLGNLEDILKRNFGKYEKYSHLT